MIPTLTSSGVAHVYDFSTNVIPGQEEHERGYWRDVGTLDAYYWANMDLLGALPSFSLYNPEWPVYSLQLPLPPAKLCYGSDGSAASVDNSLLCTGSIVSGGRVERSIIGPDVRIEAGAEVTESILMPGVRVDAGARLHRCIIDKNVIVPNGYRLGVEGGAEPDHARPLRPGDHRGGEGPAADLRAGVRAAPPRIRVPAWWLRTARSATIWAASETQRLVRRSPRRPWCRCWWSTTNHPSAPPRGLF